MLVMFNSHVPGTNLILHLTFISLSFGLYMAHFKHALNIDDVVSSRFVLWDYTIFTMSCFD